MLHKNHSWFGIKGTALIISIIVTVFNSVPYMTIIYPVSIIGGGDKMNHGSGGLEVLTDFIVGIEVPKDFIGGFEVPIGFRNIASRSNVSSVTSNGVPKYFFNK